MVYVDNFGFVNCDFMPDCPAEFGSYCMNCPLLKINKKENNENITIDYISSIFD